MKTLLALISLAAIVALPGCVTVGYNPRTGAVSLAVGPAELPLPQKGGLAK